MFLSYDSYFSLEFLLYFKLFVVLLIIIFLFFIGKKIQSILRGTVSQEIQKEDLTGQIICITGGNRGIGFETVKILIDWGSIVILGVRDVQSCENMLNNVIPKHLRNHVIVGQLNLDSFDSVKQFVKKYFIEPKRRLDCLINNAHHSGLSKTICTKDNIEYSFQVNYLSHCLLTLLLLPIMINSNNNNFYKTPRIVVVGSRTHIYGKIKRETYSEKGRGIYLYDPNTIYPDTKLMQLLFNKTLTSHLQKLGLNITSNYVHPGGLVDTCDTWFRGSEYSLALRIEPMLAKIVGTNVKDAARAVVKVATLKPKILTINNQLFVEGNKYFDTTYEINNNNNNSNNNNDKDKDNKDELWLWEETIKLIGLSNDYLNTCFESKLN